MAPHAQQEEHSNGDDHGDHRRRNHFLVAAYGIQGHINPARALARRLALVGGSTVTLCVPFHGHRRMFPTSVQPSPDDDDEEAVHDGVISYVPFSDGIDDGSWPKDSEERTRRRKANFDSLSAVVTHLAAGGRPPVTCVVTTLNMPAVVEVARAHGIPLAVYWIQPAAVLAAYYHYFHGHGELIAAHVDDPSYEVNLPGVSTLMIRDLPSFFADVKTTGNELSKMILGSFRDLFEQMDKEKPMVVLINTMETLEDTTLRSMQPYMDVYAVGPALPHMSTNGQEATIHLFKDDEKDYMEWVESQPEKSVVYVSFGSLVAYTKRQAEEILRGLEGMGRPYLWVVRKEGRDEAVSVCLGEATEGNRGMVVEWCDQMKLLSHRSVGCFVTHCGWNSTVEAIASGVPMVAMPSWSDQPTNAHLVEAVWGVGIRAERDAEGILTGEELARCVELVMGDNGKSMEIRANANALKERAREAISINGSSDKSLRQFVKKIENIN